MPSYPTSYRKGAERYGRTGPSNQAFKDLVGRNVNSDFERMLQSNAKGYTRPKAAPNIVRYRRTLGHAELAERLLERYLERAGRRLIFRRLAGPIGLAQDIVELIKIADELGIPLPEIPPDPGGYDFPGWVHYGPWPTVFPNPPYVSQELLGEFYANVSVTGKTNDNGITNHPLSDDPDTYHASRWALWKGVKSFGDDTDWTSEEAWYRPEDAAPYSFRPASPGSPGGFVPPEGSDWANEPWKAAGEAGWELLGPPDMKGKPSEVPAAETTVYNTPTRKPETVVRQHDIGPPDGKTKERKFIASRGSKFILNAAINQLTEAADAIRALWDTLPKEDRPGSFIRINYYSRDTRQWEHFYKRMDHDHEKSGDELPWGEHRWASPTLVEMWSEVLQSWQHVDVQEAIINLAKNHIQDMLIGSANQRTQKNLTRSGLYKRSVGFGYGPSL